MAGLNRLRKTLLCGTGEKPAAKAAVILNLLFPRAEARCYSQRLRQEFFHSL